MSLEKKNHYHLNLLTLQRYLLTFVLNRPNFDGTFVFGK